MITAEAVLFFVPSLGMWVIFFWLYVREKNYSSRIQEARLKEMQTSARIMAEVLAAQSIKDVHNAVLDAQNRNPLT